MKLLLHRLDLIVAATKHGIPIPKFVELVIASLDHSREPAIALRINTLKTLHSDRTGVFWLKRFDTPCLTDYKTKTKISMIDEFAIVFPHEKQERIIREFEHITFPTKINLEEKIYNTRQRRS